MENKLLGKRIKKARLEKRLTQEKFAEILDLSVSFISQVEAGKKKLSLTRLIEVSNILEKPIDYFITGYEVQDNEYIIQIIKLLNQMSTTKQKLFLEILKLIYSTDDIY